MSDIAAIEMLECAKKNLENAIKLQSWLFVEIAQSQLEQAMSELEEDDKQ